MRKKSDFRSRLLVLFGIICVTFVLLIISSGIEKTAARVTRDPGRDLGALGENCTVATTLLLNTPLQGTTVGAANDYELSGAGCFTGIGNTPSTAAGNELVYSFTAPSAGNYSFRVTHYGGGDLVLYTASSCPAGAPPVNVGTCLGAANRLSVSTAEEVPCISLAASQNIFVFVDENAATGGGSFTLEATRCAQETEPNDTPGTADPLIFGGQGSVSPAGDADFYSLGTPPVGSRIFALVDGVSSNINNYDLRVTTATDTLEYDDQNAAPAFGSFSGTVAGTPLTGVPSFLRVDSVAEAEPYRIYATVQPPIGSAVVETEPNDTIGSADSAAINYFSGSLPGPAPSSDVDVYAFTAQTGDLIFLGLDGDPLRDATPINGRLELLNSVGATLQLVNDAGASSDTTSGAGSLTSTTPHSPAESIVLKATSSGTFYARVTTLAPGAPGAGDYLLSIFVFPSGPTAADGTVTGRITDVAGEPVSGTVINLSGTQTRRTITDALGKYSFSDVETNGFYTVTPARPNFQFSPSSRSFSQLGERTEAVFTGLQTVDLVNPLDTPEYFVRQQYLDLLGREPEEEGFNYWSNRIRECGTDVRCVSARRRDVAAAFFIEREYQQTGSFIHGLYKGALGRQPAYAEFSVDRTQITEGPTLEALKQAFAEGFVQRAEFVARYQAHASGASFVDALLANISQSSGVDLRGQRDDLINAYNAGTDQFESRAAVLRAATDAPQFKAAEYNASFVLNEYFGYLRRDPDPGGFRFWLDVLNNREPGNFRGMVCAFINSAEYQLRFSSVVSRNDHECSR